MKTDSHTRENSHRYLPQKNSNRETDFVARIILLWIILLFTLQEVHGQTLKGIVKDQDEGSTLPYATINFEGTTEGTISNGEGYFELTAPKNLKNAAVQISYMGYETRLIPAEKFGESILIISLKRSTLTLQELVIRPLSPEGYIKRAVKNRKNSLPSSPFMSQSYYREKFMENGRYLMFSEGVFKSYYPQYQDTTANQHQLLLYETADNPQQLQFMRETFEKKSAKERRKAKKKGEEYEDHEEEFVVIENSFGGPDQILSMDLGKNLDNFLDSTMFVKFRYHFAEPVQYQGRELLVIGFKSKGTVDHLKSEGKIYIDLKTDAFAAIEFTARPIIPIIVQPILLAYGLSIKDPLITKTLRYQYADGTWYPEYFHVHVDLGLKKRHMFSSNERSDFEIEQLLKVTHIKANAATPIPNPRRFNNEKEMEDQVYNDENLTWKQVNRLAE